MSKGVKNNAREEVVFGLGHANFSFFCYSYLMFAENLCLKNRSSKAQQESQGKLEMLEERIENGYCLSTNGHFTIFSDEDTCYG